MTPFIHLKPGDLRRLRQRPRPFGRILARVRAATFPPRLPDMEYRRDIAALIIAVAAYAMGAALAILAIAVMEGLLQ